MTAPHPPAKAWIGRHVFHVAEPPAGGFAWHKVFRVIGIREDGDTISFQLRNRYKTIWTTPAFNHWKD